MPSMSCNHKEIRRFYDTVYHKNARLPGNVSWHLRRLARRLGPWKERQLMKLHALTGVVSWVRFERRATRNLALTPALTDGELPLD